MLNKWIPRRRAVGGGGGGGPIFVPHIIHYQVYRATLKAMKSRLCDHTFFHPIVETTILSLGWVNISSGHQITKPFDQKRETT